MIANRKNFFFVVMLLTISVFMGACINDDDNDSNPQPPEMDTVKTDGIITIDSAFHANNSALLGIWMAQYNGYDLTQRTTTTIRRVVYFTDEGVYDNHVQGLVKNSADMKDYMEFEHEHGRFIFDEISQSIAYHVEYDSIMNFNSGKLEHKAGKMSKGGAEQYEERIFFSFEKDSKRDWVRTDDNLMSVDDHAKQLVYAMRREQ